MYNEEISKTNDNFARYKERLTNFSSEFELGLFLYIMRKSVAWVALIILTSLLVSLLYLRYTKPVYQSGLILQISTENRADKILKVENIYENDDISAIIELLRSKYMLQKAIESLPLDVNYYNKGQFLTYEMYVNSPFSVDHQVTDSILLNRDIYLTFTDENTVNLSYQIGQKEHSSSHDIRKPIVLEEALFNINVIDFDMIAQMQDEFKKQEFIFRITSPEQLTNDYIKRLEITLLNNSAKTISIQFKDDNPQKTVDLVTALASVYNEHDLENKKKSSSQILDFIDAQIDIVYKRMRASESSLKSFQKDHDLPAFENYSSYYANDLNELEKNIAKLDLDLSILQEIEYSMNNATAASLDAYNLLPMLVGTQFETSVESFVQNLKELLLEREKILYEVTPDNESIKAIDFQIEIQKKLLINSITELKTNYQSRKDKLVAKSNEMKAQFFSLPEKELEFAQLKRLFSKDEKFFTLLSEKRTEYSISKAGFVPQNVILEKADVPSTPISPNKSLIISSFILGGVAMSLLMLIIRYLVHNQITSLNEITRHTHASIGILGIIPKYKEDIPVSQLIVGRNPKSLIAESFRSVRSNLQFISNEVGSKVMAITSTISGEGKTFIALNLAGIIAYTGKKVIILDLDMRRPKIHSGFDVPNDKGMSTLLIEKDTIEDTIRHSELENLDFITAGPIPPNPSELIINGKIESILEELKKSYDVIIIDNPPVGLVTDGISIIKMADYPIYIFRAEYSKKNFIQNVDRLYNENQMSKLSIVLNGVDINKRSYGYNYGYGYGYGYAYSSSYGGYYEDQGKKKKKKKFNLKQRK